MNKMLPKVISIYDISLGTPFDVVISLKDPPSFSYVDEYFPIFHKTP